MLNMSRMFQNAVDFNKLLCGDSWIESSANMFLMFDGSGGGAIGNEIFVCNTPGEFLADGACLTAITTDNIHDAVQEWTSDPAIA